MRKILKYTFINATTTNAFNSKHLKEIIKNEMCNVNHKIIDIQNIFDFYKKKIVNLINEVSCR